jgi:DNA-binding MarR family transcriptional regulator
MEAANPSAGTVARTGRDETHAQESTEGTPCEDCYVQEAEGVNPEGRALCRSCARLNTLICDGGRETSLADLSAFQRDVLWTLAEDGASKGLAIKASLEEYYSDEVNHGRLYPNLDALVDHGLVAKSQRDRRTNEYALTDAGREALTERVRWQATEEVPASTRGE